MLFFNLKLAIEIKKKTIHGTRRTDKHVCCRNAKSTKYRLMAVSILYLSFGVLAGGMFAEY